MIPRYTRRHAARAATLLDVPFGAYEAHVLRQYALAVLTPPKGRSELEINENLAAWYRDNRATLGFKIEPIEKYLRKTSADAPEDRLHLLGARLAFPARKMPLYDAPAPPPSALQKRLDFIARTLRLSAGEAAFLAAAVRLTLVPRFRELYEAAFGDGAESDEVGVRNASRMAGLGERRQLLPPTHHDSPLSQLGLVEDRGGGDVAVCATVIDILNRRTTDSVKLRADLFGASQPSTLEPEDFAHLGAATDRLVAILSGALDRRTVGASVLFHGPPGTGKTEFARLLGPALGAAVVFIGESVRGEARNRREEPNRYDRLAHLAFASALGDRAGRVVLVIDEADDVFTGVDADEGDGRVGSKVFMNRVVENCPVPMVWITNHTHRLGPAVLRRMLMAVEFREPNRAVRARIVARQAAAVGVALAEADVARLAALPASPALIRAGLTAASLAGEQAGGFGDTAEAVVRSLMRATGRSEAIGYPAGPIAFDAALSNADTDLAALEERVAAAGPGPLSFLFSGMPGTGKSAFARHLAARLRLEVIEKRASDLLGMFVGQSEQQIADAFAEAADARAFLLFDEADSLVFERAGAVRSFEVSQVNEMLTQMERHPFPFAATTNLAARLDSAANRRFLFKVAFRPMTPAQAREAFLRTFGTPAPFGVEALDPLTPGDFAVVARRAAVLREGDPAALAEMLAAEVEAKPGKSRRIGF